jgi:SAM-dependent methyltransferase
LLTRHTETDARDGRLVPSRSIESYEARTTAELAAYAKAEAGTVHDLPPVHHLWGERFVTPLFDEVGVSGGDELWLRSIAEQCRRTEPEPARVVSLGAGNGEAELQLVARLSERGVTNLELVLLELNPAMIRRAVQNAERLGLRERVSTEQVDLNTWVAREPTDVYLAVHILHHVVGLEHLFDQIASSLHPAGVLLVNDIVGRNGHVRWPEAGGLARRIWNTTPERYRYNHYTHEVDIEFPDADSST